MGFRFSKSFGPTDSAAATITTIGSAYIVPPGGPYHIHEMLIGKGNVVDAKQCSGMVKVIVTTIEGGLFEYAYGNGSGAATNTGQNKHAEKIQCRIPAPSGASVTVRVEDAENAKDVTVSCAFWTGRQQLNSYCWTDANQDTTADTELTLLEGALGLITITRPGHIRQIRFAGSGVADAKAGSGILVLEVPGQGLPQEFAVGDGPGGDSLGGSADADVIGDLDKPNSLGIGAENNGPIPKNTAIVAKLTTAEIMLSAMCSIQVG